MFLILKDLHFMMDPDFPDMPGEPEYLRGGEDAYARFAVDRAIEAAGRMLSELDMAREVPIL